MKAIVYCWNNSLKFITVSESFKGRLVCEITTQSQALQDFQAGRKT